MRSTTFRPDLEGFRGLAVVLVLAYHFRVPHLEAGFVGVDLFFVLSGFLITGLLLKEQERGGVDLLEFFARRVRRILVPSAVVLVSVASAMWAVLGRSRVFDLAAEFILSALMLGNVAAARNGEYLSGVSLPSPILHYWSLAVEEQFYLLWPLLLVLLWKVLPYRPLVSVRIASVSVLVVSLPLSWVLTSLSPGVAYYAPHVRAWELAAGALLATVGPAPRRPVVPVGTALLVASLSFIGPDSAFPGLSAVLPVAAAVGLISAGSLESRLLAAAPLRWLGRISFSLYLWHWPVLVIVEERYGYLSALNRALLVPVVLVLAWISTLVVENPSRSKLFAGSPPARSLVLVPVLAAASMLLPAVSLLTGPPQEPDEAPSAAAPSAASSAATTGSTAPPIVSPAVGYVPPEPSTVLLVGDSTLAPLRWFVGADQSLQGFPHVLDAESCRKLSGRSCTGGREERTPPTAVEAIRSATPADVLVVMGGYHSHPQLIRKEFRAVIAAARDKGFDHVLWLNWRESEEFPGVGGASSTYEVFNSEIREEISSGGYEDVTVLDWNGYTSSKDSWFTHDGIHVNLTGALGLGEYLSSALAVLDGRPCPQATEPGPCSRIPDPADDSALLDRYGLEWTTIHCYEMGKDRTEKCKVDRNQR